jgi:2-oxoisovalerate ferredoxin oxidoreductase beta subunit
MSTALFTHFDRHAHGKGLKGAATHYCPGCGHGLAHKYLAEAIEKLQIEDRTIAISPVGCSVFLYYYFDVGNTQAAHGRAPAVAIGHKMANPKSIVISYQGDGDLASIGISEIIHAAQLGVPLSVIFINNAIYGMTGGQMAPTTLPGMTSTTCPRGRGRLEGVPLKMAEMIAGIDGSVYVERVALYDNKVRAKAKKAILKALKTQVDNRGFAFVEVLAECPTHLRMSGPEAEEWVRDQMVPLYPLGVLKDEEGEDWFNPPPRNFEPSDLLNVIDASDPAVPRYAKAFPTHLDPSDVSIKLAGAGGDGAQTAAMLLTKASINEGFDATHIPSYGPESRGGTSYADVHVAVEEVLSPAAPDPRLLVAFNAPSLDKFGPVVREGGIAIYDSSVIQDVPKVQSGVQLVAVPCTQIALEVGKLLLKNTVALGALQAASGLFPPETFLEAIRRALAAKPDLIPMNEEAFRRGMAAAQEQMEGATNA